MAAVTATTSGSATLAANTADTVTFPLNYRTFEVVNRGATELWVRADGITAVVGAAGCTVVLPTSRVRLNNPTPVESASALVVSVISTGTMAYSVNAGPAIGS